MAATKQTKKTAAATKKAAGKPASKAGIKPDPKAAKSKPATKAKAKPAPKAKAKPDPKAQKGKPAAPAKPKAPPRHKPRASTGMALVVVESPAKAKTIKKYLGPKFEVKASVGHVMDLPKSKIGVDVENGFVPEYVAIHGKGKIIADIRKSAKDADIVYLAPDPDREGEAIAWHLANEIKSANPNVRRVLFNEITKRGVTEALEHPGDLNERKFESQQARRILDRLVGYEISPILWNKVQRGLSAGRVQSVAVRIVVEREREIAAFVPVEYWTVDVKVEGLTPPAFTVHLVRLDGKKVELSAKDEAHAVAQSLRQAPLVVRSVEKKERKRYPTPPFITSRLQQEAARKLRYTAKRTMGLAQRLYEGVELGDEGPTGLITYMRTDSTRLSDDAVAMARTFIENKYGRDYLPEGPVVYKTKKSAQDAHEAIRPTSLEHPPEKVRTLLLAAAPDADKRREAEDLVRLYTLIWNRFVACQMVPAIYDQTTIDVIAEGAPRSPELRATGQVMKFPGYTAAYTVSTEETGEDESSDGSLPPIEEGDRLRTIEVLPDQHFTQPPPRFSEASLVKELEEKGIGRPSTYASILSTIQDRGYVEKREGRFYPTMLGTKVNDLLVESFPAILDLQFTAKMEDDLDQIEEGQVEWKRLLGDFYSPFKAELTHAATHMRDLKREETPTEHSCEKCGKNMVIKWGRNGEFLACSGYPECKNTREFKRRDDGTIEIIPEPTTDEICPTCGAPMAVRKGRFGTFLACSRYPECKTTKPITLGIVCPRPDCGGQLVEKRSKRGKTFFGCNNYSKTKCDFAVWDRPKKQPCPNCGATFVVERQRRDGHSLRCVTPDCGWVEGGAPVEADNEVDADEDAA